MVQKTLVISAFPGTGKTYCYKQLKKDDTRTVLDSDSSKFPKDDFPRNYIEHIKSKINVVNTIFVSSHKDVRDELVKEEIKFLLIYPDRDLKEEYKQRYIERGSPDNFIQLLDKNWDNWISELEEQKNCGHLVLKKGEYIFDYM